MASLVVYLIGGLLPAYLLAQFVYQVIYYRFFHPLSKFPGPFWGSVTRLWIAWHNIKGDEPWTFRALHKKYGESCLSLPCSLCVCVVHWGTYRRSDFCLV